MILRVLTYVWIGILGFTLFACRKDKTPPIIQEYLFLSHTKHSSGLVHPDVYALDFSSSDILLLGGDLNMNSTSDEYTIESLDLLFDLSSPTTLWTIGESDDSNTEHLLKTTQRNTYYSYYQHGITFVVLDSQLENCDIEDNQEDLLEDIVDTIQESSHLIVMTHKLIWLDHDTISDAYISGISNGPRGSCDHCIYPNNFYKDIYEELEEIQERGIQVICLAGDLGQNVSSFSLQTEKGIQFLACGFNPAGGNNKVLRFEHNIQERTLTWKFESP